MRKFGGVYRTPVLLMLQNIRQFWSEVKIDFVPFPRFTDLCLDGNTATSYRTPEVKAFLKANRIALAMMPASTTYRFQMIDVVVGKLFKDKMCDQWATWMLEESQKLGTTAAGNYKHPSYVDCLNWVVQA